MTTPDTTRSTLRDKGQLTLPSAVRRALGVDVGDDLEFEVLSDGRVLLSGLKMIPAEQSWFWTDSWQKGEREASQDIEFGRFETFKDDESFLSSLGEEI